MLTWTDRKVLAGLMRKMALEGWVRPRDMLAPTLPDDQLLRVLEALRPACTLGCGQRDGLWRLGDIARRHVFKRWSTDAMARALEYVKPNAVANAIKWVTGMSAGIAFDTASAQELIGLRAALTWLPGSKINFTCDDNAFASQIERARLREDVQLLVGETMVGRKTHLKRMQVFFAGCGTSGQRGALLISGGGGCGKSTLLIKFFDMLQGDQRYALLRFDFDRADLNPLQQTSLDRELVEQLGRAVPALRNQSSQSVRNLRTSAAETARAAMASSASNAYGNDSAFNEGGMYASEGAESSRSDHKSEVGGMLTRLGDPVTRMLVMFDTFERVEAAGSRAIDAVLDWIADIAAMAPIPVCIVIAGRRELDPTHPVLHYSEHMRLGVLTRPQARSLLERHGCDTHLATLLAQHVQARSPLVLRLAAETFLASTARERTALLADLGRGAIPQNLLSGYLYTRILAHIDQPLLRRYAQASLALPELTVELIGNVLVPHLEPGLRVGDGYAQQIFDALAKVHWLMEKSDGGRLRLRPDVRSLVVELIDTDSGSRALHATIRSAAENYHRLQASAWDRAMAFYHEIMRDSERAGASRQVQRRYAGKLREHARYLLPFIDDFPAPMRRAVTVRDGNHVDLDAAKNFLTDEEWKSLMDGKDGFDGRGQKIVSFQNPLTAHTLYASRPTATGPLPPAWALQAACDTARWEELAVDIAAACDELDQRIANARRWSPHLYHLAALLRYALFANPVGTAHQLLALIDKTMARSAAYGAAPAIADLVAVAEVFHGRHYLSPALLARIKPGDVTNRVIILHAATGMAPVGAPLTGAAFAVLDDPASARSIILDGSSTAAIDAMVEVQGQRWSQYQRLYRNLQKSSVYSLESAGPARLKLPEFYRPLRQALTEAFDEDGAARQRFIAALWGDVHLVPAELRPEALIKHIERDPYTWFYALVQYADRSNGLPGLVTLGVACAPSSASRLHAVARLYEAWTKTLPMSFDGLRSLHA